MSNLASKFYQHHPLKYMNATLNAPCAPQPFYYTIIIILQFVLQEVSQKQNSAVYNILVGLHLQKTLLSSFLFSDFSQVALNHKTSASHLSEHSSLKNPTHVDIPMSSNGFYPMGPVASCLQSIPRVVTKHSAHTDYLPKADT